MINKLLILIILLLVLTSCLEVDTIIDLKEDGTGTWSLQYKISQEAAFITPGLEFSGFNYFPVNEDDLRKRIGEIEGLELLQVSIEETANFTKYSAEMSFLNTDNIESFFNNFTENRLVEIMSDEEDGVFILTIEKPYISEIDQDTHRLLSALYSSKMIKVIVGFPGIITDLNTGILSEDPGEARLEIETIKIVTMSEPIEWIIYYE